MNAEAVARAEARLRSADPVAGEIQDADDHEGIARVLAEPRGSRRRASAARVALGAAGLAALATLIVALFLTTRDRDARMTASVSPPPLRYAVAERAQTDADRASELPPSSGGVRRQSVRLAGEDDGARLVVFRERSGALCLAAVGANGASGSGCGYPSRPTLALFGSDGLFDGGHLGYGLVPDGITTVVVDGTPLEVRDNVFHLVIPKTTHRVSVDFLTDEGVVTAWHQDLPVAIVRPPTPLRVEAFGAQARLLQTRPPYLGVSCAPANDIACDRVGITVWLRKPAIRVVARVWGRRIVLDDPDWSGPLTDGRRTRFAGFLQPAGLTKGPHAIATKGGSTRWLGDPPVTVPVGILVFTTPGSASSAAMRVRLHPGWG